LNTVIVKEYKQTDWHTVCQIHDLARPIELLGSCDKRAFTPLAADAGDLQNFNDSIKHVAYYKDVAAGFSGTRDNELTWLYVDPVYFGRGIGRVLLSHALSNFQGQPYLYVLSENQAAIALYRSTGFNEVKRSNTEVNGFRCTLLKLTKIS